MKILSETKALLALHDLKADFQEQISSNYEHKAKSCATCETKGACCLDEHFVNVHITRLEAEAMKRALQRFSDERRREIYRRVRTAIDKYKLSINGGDTFSRTYACPLFEKESGCLVHEQGKPAPCIAHACYENKEDLPPEKSLAAVEEKIGRLNKRTYQQEPCWLPIPLWLNLIDSNR